MNKILIPIILIIGVLGVFIFIQLNDTANPNIKAETLDLKTEIEKFTAIDGEDRISVRKIERKVDFNKNQQVILFISNEDKLGYVILKDKKILTVAYGDKRQGFDQYKDYFIVFAEKPKLEYIKLNLLIEAKNHEDINKSVTLGEGKYYLEVQGLPQGMKESIVYMDNYIFE